MATSSIKKQFIAKDIAAFEKLLKDAENEPVRKVNAYENSSLDRGRKALAQFFIQEKSKALNV